MRVITMEAALEAMSALTELVKTKRPFAGALRMRSLVRVLSAQLEGYEPERLKLLKEYAKLGEDGEVEFDETRNAVFPSPEQRNAFGKALTELLEVEFECPVTLTVKDLGGVDVEPNLLLALGDLLEEPVDEPVKKPELVKDKE